VDLLAAKPEDDVLRIACELEGENAGGVLGEGRELAEAVRQLVADQRGRVGLGAQAGEQRLDRLGGRHRAGDRRAAVDAGDHAVGGDEPERQTARLIEASGQASGARHAFDQLRPDLRQLHVVGPALVLLLDPELQGEQLADQPACRAQLRVDPLRGAMVAGDHAPQTGSALERDGQGRLDPHPPEVFEVER
jgi:hypothetical protein